MTGTKLEYTRKKQVELLVRIKLFLFSILVRLLLIIVIFNNDLWYTIGTPSNIVSF